MPNMCYSENGEEYRYEDIEEAIYYTIDDVDSLKVGSEFSVWEGECTTRKASSYASDVLEDMGNQAYDELPDFADDWPNASNEQAKELTEGIAQLIDQWADKYQQQPTFGVVSNCKERFFKITEMAECTDDIKYVEFSGKT